MRTSRTLESLSRVIPPVVGGWLLGAIGTRALGVVGDGIMAGVRIFVWRRQPIGAGGS